MWPNLFGPGWFWDVLLSAGLFAIVAAVIGRFVSPHQPAGSNHADQDPTQAIWHRYEEGDLTPWEFARLMSPRAIIRYPERASGNTGVARRAPVH